MEGGALLTPEFKKFTEQTIPFLHVTAKIEGRANDDLLSKKGFNSFPTFAVLDSDGEVVAKHAPGTSRDAEGFQKTLDSAALFIDLKKRAEGGDRDAKIELAIVECELGRIEMAECDARLAELGELNAEQKAALGRLRANATVMDEVKKFQDNRSQESFEAMAKVFVGMVKSGTTPSAGQADGIFTQVLASYAMNTKSVEDAKTLHAFLKEKLKDNPRASGFLDKLAGKIADMQMEEEETEPEETEEGESEVEESTPGS